MASKLGKVGLTEAEVEAAAIEYLTDLDYDYVFGPVLAPDGASPERASYGDVVLVDRLRRALGKVNPQLDAETLDGVARRIQRRESLDLIENNVAFRGHLTRGIDVQIRKDGQLRGELAWLVDFERPERNDWLVVNQFTIVQGREHRRPDLVVFLNGLPIAVIELKNPEDPNATLQGAWNQLQTYKEQVPALFDTNELLIVSDGTEAKVGSLTAGYERFGPWRTVDGLQLAPLSAPKLDVLIAGLFEKRRLLDYLRHFIFWEIPVEVPAKGGGNDAANDPDKRAERSKKIAGYHQFHAVNKAITHTIRASQPQGDQRIGVIWHTQGSGKSITMALYVGKLILERHMRNPTVVVITDRNDLDGQLFGQFCAAPGLVPQPAQAESREHLRTLLQVASGGVIFTTIQKFGVPKLERFPVLSERRNIVVMTDEAHRSQYELIEGLARNLRDGLPHASFIGFTGTPIELADKSTRGVFGEDIDTYPISQAVEDQATVPIHYEARLARIKLPEERRPKIDDDFEEVTEKEEEAVKGRLKSRWARLEAMVGTEERLALVAGDIVAHFERRTEILEGKAMIVVMSRRIAFDLYGHILKLRPGWGGTNDEDGAVKIVMTGSAEDALEWQPHIRSKAKLRVIERRFKAPADPLRIVIVRDMWLTGFDAPCAHTLYLDKPMQGHGLMQTIARVNRVFKDKPAGLVVDYLGVAERLRDAVADYGGKQGERPTVPIDVALRVLEEKLGIVRDMFHGFDYSGYFGTQAKARLEALQGGGDRIAGLPDGIKRFRDGMAALNRAAAIALHLEGARQHRDEVGYFQGVESNLRKHTTGGSGKTNAELNHAIRQIVAGAVAGDGVIDIFDTANLSKPDISILSDEFLETVRTSPYKNLQLELLKKLLNDEIRAISRRNLVQGKKFSDMLLNTLTAYTNRSLETAQVILELIEVARQMREQAQRGTALGLTEDELAFYDALTDHGGVKEIMGDKALAEIAHDLVAAIRSSVTIDWTQKEAVRADLRRKVKKLLRKHGYPPDKAAQAVATVLEQAETLCKDWADTPASAGKLLSFRRLNADEARSAGGRVPIYDDLVAAAGAFSAPHRVETAAGAWAVLTASPPAPRDVFLARVQGESMNRRIPNGAYALFRHGPARGDGSEIVLAQIPEGQDSEFGAFTVKRYVAERSADGDARIVRIVLRPDSDRPEFQPLTFEEGAVEVPRVVAVLVDVYAEEPSP